MLKIAQICLTWIRRLNLLAGLVALVGFLLIAVPLAPVTQHFERSYDDPAQVRLAAACLLFVALVTIACAQLIFTRLLAMIGAAIEGRPFAAANIARLRGIGWALLAIQLLDLVLGALSAWFARATEELFGWSPSLTGWLCVLLVFVLARVFETGAELQDEVEATV